MASTRLVALCFDANDPLRLARFWADALRWEIDDETHDEIGLVPTDDTRFRIEFQPVPEQKAGKNRIHLDLTTTSIDDQKETVAGWSSSAPATSTSVRARTKVMSCSPTPKATSSASSSRTTTSSPTADASDRSRATVRGRSGTSGAKRSDGRWSGIRTKRPRSAPDGTGPFITWGGPPLAPKIGKNRLHLDIAPPTTVDQQAEVDRLVSLGATRIDIGQGEVSWVVMADPDGNEFCVLTPRYTPVAQ